MNGSLSGNEGGIKSLLDSVYDLEDFDMSELEGFIDALSNALAVNGAESQAVNFKIQDLQESFVNTESAHSRIMDVDFALESARFARNNVLVQSSAAMVKQANPTYGYRTYPIRELIENIRESKNETSNIYPKTYGAAPITKSAKSRQGCRD